MPPAVHPHAPQQPQLGLVPNAPAKRTAEKTPGAWCTKVDKFHHVVRVRKCRHSHYCRYVKYFYLGLLAIRYDIQRHDEGDVDTMVSRFIYAENLLTQQYIEVLVRILALHMSPV
jgi:hypothetical protein